MELSQIIPHIEALVFASDKPLINIELVELLNNALGFIEDRATIEQVDAAIEGIHEKYNSEFYAFELKQSGGGWQFLTKKEYHKTVAQLNGDKFLKKLSTAALETLAIIAYKQPIAKSEMEAIRGVNCDYAVQKLLEKDLVIISGRNEDAVGKPLIYTTSKSFMDYFGINSTADLPQISEVLMEELVQATLVNHQPQHDEIIAENEAPNDAEEIQHKQTSEADNNSDEHNTEETEQNESEYAENGFVENDYVESEAVQNNVEAESSLNDSSIVHPEAHNLATLEMEDHATMENKNELEEENQTESKQKTEGEESINADDESGVEDKKQKENKQQHPES